MRRGWIDEQLAAVARAVPAQVRADARGARALDAGRARAGRGRSGGFFSWLTLPEGCDAADLARRAAEHGVGIVPGALFFPDGRGADNVRLSFSLVDETLIDDGIERLASLVRQ